MSSSIASSLWNQYSCTAFTDSWEWVGLYLHVCNWGCASATCIAYRDGFAYIGTDARAPQWQKPPLPLGTHKSLAAIAIKSRKQSEAGRTNGRTDGHPPARHLCPGINKRRQITGCGWFSVVKRPKCPPSRTRANSHHYIHGRPLRFVTAESNYSNCGTCSTRRQTSVQKMQPRNVLNTRSVSRQHACKLNNKQHAGTGENVVLLCWLKTKCILFLFA